MKTRHCMTALAGFMILDYLCFFPLKRCLRLKGFVIPVAAEDPFMANAAVPPVRRTTLPAVDTASTGCCMNTSMTCWTTLACPCVSICGLFWDCSSLIGAGSGISGVSVISSDCGSSIRICSSTGRMTVGYAGATGASGIICSFWKGCLYKICSCFLWDFL